jgi:hypothetical protein
MDATDDENLGLRPHGKSHAHGRESALEAQK